VEEEVTDAVHIVTTALLLLAIIAMSIYLLYLTDNAFALVLGVTGGVAQSITCFILPGVIGYLAFPAEEPFEFSDDDMSVSDAVTESAREKTSSQKESLSNEGSARDIVVDINEQKIRKRAVREKAALMIRIFAALCALLGTVILVGVVVETIMDPTLADSDD